MRTNRSVLGTGQPFPSNVHCAACGQRRGSEGPVAGRRFCVAFSFRRRVTIEHRTQRTGALMLLSDFKNIVDTEELDGLVGKIEGQFFDAKGQPYLFDVGADAKREFAKDVASFANAAGGCIFIGIAMKTSVVMAGEEVEALKPVPQKIFDPDQHQKILFDWVYPVPKDLVIKWVQWGSDPNKGVGIIFVPEQDERN